MFKSPIDEIPPCLICEVFDFRSPDECSYSRLLLLYLNNTDSVDLNLKFSLMFAMSMFLLWIEAPGGVPAASLCAFLCTF